MLSQFSSYLKIRPQASPSALHVSVFFFISNVFFSISDGLMWSNDTQNEPWMGSMVWTTRVSWSAAASSMTPMGKVDSCVVRPSQFSHRHNILHVALLWSIILLCKDVLHLFTLHNITLTV